MSAFSQRGINAYRQTEAQSRSPLELVVMLYDGLLRFTIAGREAMQRGDIAARHRNLSRALDIVSELQSTLNMEAGGQIAVTLDGLYNYLRDRIMEATITQDAKPLEDAIRVIENLREGWAGISQRTPPPAGR